MSQALVLEVVAELDVPRWFIDENGDIVAQINGVWFAVVADPRGATIYIWTLTDYGWIWMHDRSRLYYSAGAIIERLHDLSGQESPALRGGPHPGFG